MKRNEKKLLFFTQNSAKTLDKERKKVYNVICIVSESFFKTVQNILVISLV